MVDEDEDSSRCVGSLRKLDSDMAAVLVPSPGINKQVIIHDHPWLSVIRDCRWDLPPCNWSEGCRGSDFPQMFSSIFCVSVFLPSPASSDCMLALLPSSLCLISTSPVLSSSKISSTLTWKQTNKLIFSDKTPMLEFFWTIQQHLPFLVFLLLCLFNNVLMFAFTTLAVHVHNYNVLWQGIGGNRLWGSILLENLFFFILAGIILLRKLLITKKTCF